MLIDLAKMAKINKFGLANSLLDSPMATSLTLTGTMPGPGQRKVSSLKCYWIQYSWYGNVIFFLTWPRLLDERSKRREVSRNTTQSEWKNHISISSLKFSIILFLGAIYYLAVHSVLFCVCMFFSTRPSDFDQFLHANSDWSWNGLNLTKLTSPP